MDEYRPRAAREPHPGAMASTSRSSPSGVIKSMQTSPKEGLPGARSSNSSPNMRPDLQMTTSSPYRSPTMPTALEETENHAASSRRLAPPPLAPYALPDDRYFAPLPDRNQNSSSVVHNHPLSSYSGRNPSVPPPQRPAPSYLPPAPSKSQPPPSPPSSRGAHASSSSSSAVGKRDRSVFISAESERRHQRPPSPPSSRETYPAPPRLSHHSTAVSHEMTRTHSQSSQNSGFSAPPTGRISRSPSIGSSEGDETGVSQDQSQSDPALGGNPTLQRPKRTRVLMTHMQQQKLGLLWKKSKFPTTQEREDIALEVGLTPRQVQVWFQNRRQTFRKQIQQNAVPQNSDPADYSDLQKSPRSRRLSLEAANANMEDQDRGSHWTGRSSSSHSSYSGRVHQSAAMSGQPESLDAPMTRPLGPRVEPSFAHSPPSPIQAIYEPDLYYRPPPGVWHRSEERPSTGSSAYRPGTSSSSSYPTSVASYGGTLNRSWHPAQAPIAPPPFPTERRHSYWDNQPPTINSPIPYSPPPTADSSQHDGYFQKHSISRPVSSYSKDWERPPSASERKRRHTTFDAGALPTRGRRTPSPIGQAAVRQSHLPPSLAALAITRPLSTGNHGIRANQHHTLPSLATNADQDADLERTPRLSRHISTPDVPQASWRGAEREEDVEMTMISQRSRSTSDQVSPPAILSRTSSRGNREMSDSQTGSSSSLPRFGELFR